MMRDWHVWLDRELTCEDDLPEPVGASTADDAVVEFCAREIQEYGWSDGQLLRLHVTDKDIPSADEFPSEEEWAAHVPTLAVRYKVRVEVPDPFFNIEPE